VAGAGCATTTTVGAPSSDGAQRALAENASSDPNCGVGLLLGLPVFGAVGLGLGAAVGAVVGLLTP